MPPIIIPSRIALLLCALATPLSADPAPEAGDVRPVLAAMREELTAKPSRVLIAVEDALTMNEQAACEIVKEAIRLTAADARLVGEIVFTALSHAPAMSAVIVECAVAAAPGAIREVQAALERALGSGSAVAGSGEAPSAEPEAPAAASGKESTGKGTVAPARSAREDFAAFQPASVGIGGIYLIIPSRPVFTPCPPDDPCCSGSLSISCLRP